MNCLTRGRWRFRTGAKVSVCSKARSPVPATRYDTDEPESAAAPNFRILTLFRTFNARVSAWPQRYVFLCSMSSAVGSRCEFARRTPNLRHFPTSAGPTQSFGSVQTLNQPWADAQATFHTRRHRKSPKFETQCPLIVSGTKRRCDPVDSIRATP